jgi:Flp pilus assembly pilin Flp
LCHSGPPLCHWVLGPIQDSFTLHDGELVFRKASAWDRLSNWGQPVTNIIRQLWAEESGQDVAEYAVMLAVILVIVIGTVRLIGGNANNVFSQVSSQLAN